MKSVVVADSSALVALATCEALDLLIALFGDVRVPRAVYDEITISEKPKAEELAIFLKGRVMSINISSFMITAEGLGRGELEAMALYKLISAEYLIIDDHHARIIAEVNGIKCIGTLGILLLGKHEKLIDNMKSFIQKLQDSSLYYSESLLDKVLQLSGESNKKDN